MDYYLNHTDNMSNPNFKTVNLSKPAELLACTCGKNIFIELKANQYYGVPTDIFNGCRAVNKDYDIQVLECISCGKRLLPPEGYGVGYIINEELSKHLAKCVEDYNKRIPNGTNVSNPKQ